MPNNLWCRVGPAFLAAWAASAAFTTQFRGVAVGDNLAIAWDPVEYKYQPLVLWAQYVNQTSSKSVNSGEANITSMWILRPKKVCTRQVRGRREASEGVVWLPNDQDCTKVS